MAASTSIMNATDVLIQFSTDGSTYSLSGDGLVTYNIASGDGYSDLWAYLTGRTKLYIKFGSTTTDEKYYSGQGFLTSLDQEAAMEDNVSMSFSFEGTGVLAESTNA